MKTDKGSVFIGRKRPERGQRGIFLVPTVQLSIGTVALLFIGRGLLKLLVAAVRRPILTVVVAALVAGWIGWGPQTLALVLGISALTLVAVALFWRYADPGTFKKWVRTPARSRWRRRWVYNRNWQPAMVLTGLAKVVNNTEYAPYIRRVHSTNKRDLVLISMLAGQLPSDYLEVADQLANTFGAVKMTIRRDSDPSRLWLDFHRTGQVAAFPPMSDNNPRRSKSSVA
jgi:S-DNA-T family DNA segregation ATPase FtsK/SpoIIIE